MASSRCFENPPVLEPASGGGEVVDDFGGQKAYVSGSAGSKAAVVLISDAFGFEAPNLRKIADKVASLGYFVVVPDFLHGDPYDPSNNAHSNPGTWIQSHNPVDHFVKVFPGVAHGWAVRYSDDDAAAVTSAEEALRDMSHWFNKYLN
ncbi:alpha/beta-Hydrolases superfamily protein [Zea mays]|uniref:Alpha/beta-Hydrolases superfamily protein n=1 Tax=Zea mays TaxID=4577 RepID=A0A1D6FN66_MAIZE|nr:alpha/beta-Hydrolases superfamily protein [Zea mays]